MDVAAVVVTYNRLDKLKRVLEAIDAQSTPPASIVVVDNASTDGTSDYLRSRDQVVPTEIVTLSDNTGGAGGFSAGMERAYQLGSDFVWIMDDDCYAGPQTLEKLLDGFAGAVDELGGDVPFACSVVEFTDGSICEMNNPETTWDWGRLLVKGQQSVMVKSCSFVSVLIPRWVLEKHGLPYAEYFIWFDDHEYTLRLTRVCPGVQVLDSAVVHDMGDNKGVNFGGIDSSNAWKFAYGIRNEASYRRHHESFASFAIFAARLIMMMRRGRVGRRLQVKMGRQLLRGLRFDPKVRFPTENATG